MLAPHDCMDAGVRATQEQLPVGQTILGQPPRRLEHTCQPMTKSSKLSEDVSRQQDELVKVSSTIKILSKHSLSITLIAAQDTQRTQTPVKVITENLKACLSELLSELVTAKVEFQQLETKIMCSVCQSHCQESYLLGCHHMLCEECVKALPSGRDNTTQCPRCCKRFSKTKTHRGISLILSSSVENPD